MYPKQEALHPLQYQGSVYPPAILESRQNSSYLEPDFAVLLRITAPALRYYTEANKTQILDVAAQKFSMYNEVGAVIITKEICNVILSFTTFTCVNFTCKSFTGRKDFETVLP